MSKYCDLRHSTCVNTVAASEAVPVMHDTGRQLEMEKNKCPPGGGGRGPGGLEGCQELGEGLVSKLLIQFSLGGVRRCVV